MRGSSKDLFNSGHGSTYESLRHLANADFFLRGLWYTNAAGLQIALQNGDGLIQYAVHIVTRPRRHWITYSLTVYLLDNFGYLLQQYGLQALSTTMEDASCEDWWHRTNEAANGQLQQGVNSLVILGARTLLVLLLL